MTKGPEQVFQATAQRDEKCRDLDNSFMSEELRNPELQTKDSSIQSCQTFMQLIAMNEWREWEAVVGPIHSSHA
jgi:hypothetical protein